MQEYVGIPMTGNDLREAKESLSMGDSYENKIGFGYEEWLLDDSRIF